MVIIVEKDQVILGEQLYRIIVDGVITWSNLNYQELCAITLGDLDKMDNI